MTSQQQVLLENFDVKLLEATLEEANIGYDISFVAYKAFKSALTDKVRCTWNFLDITFSVIELADAMAESD